MSYLTTGERIGLEKGRQEGRQEGLQQGLMEEGRAMVFEALTERFGSVPTAVSEALEQVADRNQLHSLLRHAIRCASVDDFTRLLSETGKE